MGTGARRGQGGGMSELQPHPMRQLRRARRGRIVAGVCSGIGEYVGVDPNIVRIALAIASFFGGLGIGVYAVAWLLIPEEGKSTSIVQDLIDKQKARQADGSWPRFGDWPSAPDSPAPAGTSAPYGTGGAPDDRTAAAPEQAPAGPRTTGERPGTDV
nr:MAG: hypothetical protein DIU60_21915 [Actinomycetota bacterium]